MALEAGIRNQRIDSVLEVAGEIPTTGTFIPFGDVIKRFSWNPDASVEARRGIGGVDPVGHDAGLENHTAEIAYLLQGTIAAGTPLYEAFVRDSDNVLAERTIVQREKHFTGGSESNGVRTYVVLEGAKPATAKIPGDPGQAGPIEVVVGYTAEKGREYEINQPSTAVVICVVSSNALDNGGTITIEDDAGTQEAISISGTSSVMFDSIDAMELTAECLGDISLLVTAESGATLATILGSAAYDGTEGDLGVPALTGTRSRTATLATAYEKFLGDEITDAGGDLAYEINSVELSVDNSVEARPRHNKRAQRIVEGNRTIQLTATVMGENEHFDQVSRYLQTTQSDIVWTFTSSTLTVDDAVLVDVGEKTVEEGGAFLAFDCVFEGEKILMV